MRIFQNASHVRKEDPREEHHTTEIGHVTMVIDDIITSGLVNEKTTSPAVFPLLKTKASMKRSTDFVEEEDRLPTRSLSRT